MESHLKLEPGQQELTPAQQTEAKRFFAECIQAQLSTEPVDEQKAEAFLKQAYEAAGVPPPTQIFWLDGPLQLVSVLAPASGEERVRDRVQASMGDNVWESLLASVQDSRVDKQWNSMWATVGGNVGGRVWRRARDSVKGEIWHRVEPIVYSLVVGNIWWEHVRDSVWESVQASGWDSVQEGVQASVRTYFDAITLARFEFFHNYLAPNDFHALARLNQIVSGYWLGRHVALLVRRPRILSFDAQERLHSATGPCVAYPDGWGFYAWHGVRVPEQVILAPEQLTRENFLSERNLEVRRIIQERMGERFVTELGGVVIDMGPHGMLYEVRLPEDDPERVALYVQVQDASTSRQYFLRVPPTIQTAAEAVAWSFQMTAKEYDPAQET